MRRGGGALASLPRAIRRIAFEVFLIAAQPMGWQSQPGGEHGSRSTGTRAEPFCSPPGQGHVRWPNRCGVHGINQVVHLDTDIHREPFSWVRGPNAFLPSDIAVQWANEVTSGFHARNSARGRRGLRAAGVTRAACDRECAGRWVFRPLNQAAMERAAAHLIGEHDFSSFRSSQCQSPTPSKH